MSSGRPAPSLAGGARGVEAYTRVSLYLFVPLEGFLYLVAVAGYVPADGQVLGAWPAGIVGVVALVHLGLCFATVHLGFDRPLVVRGRLHPVVIALLAVSGLVVVAALVLLPAAGPPEMSADARSLTILACGAATFGALAVGFPFRRLAVAGLAVPAAILVVRVVDGLPGAPAVAIFAYALVAFWAGTVRLSMWILEVVRELETSREVSARLAVAEERLRIARDMHDVVGRALSAVAVKSELSAALARRGDEVRAADEMDEVRVLAQDSLREVRGVVAGYRAPDLPTELAGARSVLRAAGIDVRVTGAVPALDASRQEALAWVVREGVTNVVRHSRAAECWIMLDDGQEHAELRIRNDGVGTGDDGPDSAGVVPSGADGTGLAGLRERLTAVGGTLDSTRDGDRFTLVARVPTTGGHP